MLSKLPVTPVNVTLVHRFRRKLLMILLYAPLKLILMNLLFITSLEMLKRLTTVDLMRLTFVMS